MGPSEISPQQRSARLAWLVAILLITAALQVWFALNKGLVLDEFHSHFHSTRESWAAFWDTLLKDNHPPLSFLVIGTSARLFGDGELALRLPAMICALVEIVLIWRLARDHGRASAGLAALLLAASSLHLDFGTQARMYALHGLAVTGCAVSITRLLSGISTRWTSIALGFWIWVGLHNHYFFAQYSIGLGMGTLLAAWIEPGARERFRTLALPIGAAALLALPWYLTGFATQFSHSLPPGGDDVSFFALLESYVHLFFLNVRIGSDIPLVGSFLRETFILGGAILTLLALFGAWCGLSRAAPPRTRIATALLASVAFIVPCGAILLANLLPRCGFTWHYILPSVAAEAWLIALGWRIGPFLKFRRVATVCALSAAILLCILNARSRGTEDYPAAIANILEQYQPGDAIISVEWEPILFPQGMPWDYYAHRLQANPPARLPMNELYSLLDRNAIKDVARVLILRTSLPGDQHIFRLLERQNLHKASGTDFGFGVEVMLFK